MGHTMSELSEIIDRKPAMIYNYFNESEESKSFYYSHRQARKKGGYVYDDEVLERLKKRVGVEGDVPTQKTVSEDEKIPKDTAPRADDSTNYIKEALENKISELQEKCAKYETEIARLNSENQELIRQNSNILLLLSQEKQEKQALLPAPKISIAKRIRSLFNK